MNCPKRILPQPEFHIFVFLLSAALFAWPILAIAGNNSPVCFFKYLFLTWGIVIVFQFIISRSLSEDAPDGREDERGGGSSV